MDAHRIATEMMAKYHASVETLLSDLMAMPDGSSLAVSDPFFERDGDTLAYNMRWDHRFYEPGHVPTLPFKPGVNWRTFTTGPKMRADFIEKLRL